MKFEIEVLPKEDTIAAKCAVMEGGYTDEGFIKVKPTNCILPKRFQNCIDDIRNIKVRKDDVYFVSKPRCGKSCNL